MYLNMFHKSKDHTHYTKFCKLRNSVQQQVKKAKSEYIESEIEENKNDSKKLWKTLKSLGYNSKVKGKEPMVLNINGELCFDQVTITEYINNFFVNIGKKLAELLPIYDDLYSAFSVNCRAFYNSKGVTPGMYILQKIDEVFVLQQLKALKG